MQSHLHVFPSPHTQCHIQRTQKGPMIPLAIFLYEQVGNVMNYSCTISLKECDLTQLKGDKLLCFIVCTCPFYLGKFLVSNDCLKIHIIRKPGISVFMSTQTLLFFMMLFCLDLGFRHSLRICDQKSRLIMTFKQTKKSIL